jgi:expansin
MKRDLAIGRVSLWLCLGAAAVAACSESPSERNTPKEAGGAIDGPAGQNEGTASHADGTPASSEGARVEGSTSKADAGAVVTYGSTYTGGQFHLGPVDYAETAFHNACAPSTKYASAVQAVEGDLLAGLWSGITNVSSYCDACIYVTTAKGKTALLRVVTYGSTSTNSIDVSSSAYSKLNSGEYPRTMSWQFAKCLDTGKIMYEFQTGSSEWWTSFWVRNARVPLTKVEVKCQNHDFQAATRGSDGTLTDSGGFGKGSFTIRLTGMDGTQVQDTFSWPSAGIAGQTLTGGGNFK